MMQKPWFKIFIWFISSSFFFIASVILISMLGPGPSENQIMKFMAGMMGAMENSLMGISMTIENDENLKVLLDAANYVIVPLIMVAVLGGFLIRIRRTKI